MTFFFILLSASNAGCRTDPRWSLGQAYLTCLRARRQEGDEEEGSVGAINTDHSSPIPPRTW